MSYQIQRPTNQLDPEFEKIVKEIQKIDPINGVTESSLLEKILQESLEEEKSLALGKKTVGIKSTLNDQDTLEAIQRRLDDLKYKLSEEKKESFKRQVKELIGVDVFNESICTHIPKPTEDMKDTTLFKEAGRMLEYLTKRKELANVLINEVKTFKEMAERKGPNSQRMHQRAAMARQLRELLRGTQDVIAGIRPIEKALLSFGRNSQVAYAKMVFSQFENIKAKLLDIKTKADILDMDLKRYIKEGRKFFKTTPDYVDENCEICVEKEKEWDHRWGACNVLEPLTVDDARNFHGRLVRSGGMRCLVNKFKSLLSCEISDPNIALPTIVCSMTDPKKADNLYNLISENNFLRDFKRDIFKKTEMEILPNKIKTDCKVCGVEMETCPF